MLVVVLAYQQLENNVLTPKIQGKAVQLSAFFIIVAVTLFGALLGVLGALTAVPLAATIQIFVQELTKARRGGCRGESRPRSTMTGALSIHPRSGVMAHDFQGETVRMGLLESTSFDSGVTLLRYGPGR